MHQGRRGLLHRDGVGKRIMARKRARITAITGGGAIPDVADYQVRAEPDGLFVGTLNEDFAIESNVGDIFQLGNTSWRILKVERGMVRVADAGARRQFHLAGRRPVVTPELSAESRVREEFENTGSAPAVKFPGKPRRRSAIFSPMGGEHWGRCPRKSVILNGFRRAADADGFASVWRADQSCMGIGAAKTFCRGFGFELRRPPTKKPSLSHRLAAQFSAGGRLQLFASIPLGICSQAIWINRCSSPLAMNASRSLMLSDSRTASQSRRRCCGCSRRFAIFPGRRGLSGDDAAGRFDSHGSSAGAADDLGA
jgi:hypothetical protein